MAGADAIGAPYPTGESSAVVVRLGGHVIEGAAADTIVETFVVPWNCKVKAVYYSYTKTSTNHLDGIKLRTVDDDKQLVADGDMSADIAGVKQTLHSDIVGYEISANDKIQLKADAAGTTEGGIMVAHVELIPTK